YNCLDLSRRIVKDNHFLNWHSERASNTRNPYSRQLPGRRDASIRWPLTSERVASLGNAKGRNQEKKYKGTDESSVPTRSSRYLHTSHGGFHVIDRMPGGCAIQTVIDVVNVLHTLVLEPLAKSLSALLGVDRNPIFPRGTATEHAIEFH